MSVTSRYRDFNDISYPAKIERWEQAARVLRSLDAHEKRAHFNMEYFGKKTRCGTIACAAGHCGLDPWFRRKGFKMEFHRISNGEWDDHISNVGRFFGTHGSDVVFYNSRRRGVSTVLKEIETYIAYLRAQTAVADAYAFINTATTDWNRLRARRFDPNAG